jgi:desulfoferrodoxin (superoxide reductase-like protein)
LKNTLFANERKGGYEMNRRSFLSYGIATVASFLFCGKPAFANQASVRIEVPDTVSSGQEITIKLHVSHDGNNFIHHTDWVYVKINDQEIKRWEFGAFDTPESNNFTREIKYMVMTPIVITSEANCNLHGSTGISEKKVMVP